MTWHILVSANRFLWPGLGKAPVSHTKVSKQQAVPVKPIPVLTLLGLSQLPLAVFSTFSTPSTALSVRQRHFLFIQ
jgi:hypothetical protein